MTAPHGAVSVHPSEDAGVPLSEEIAEDLNIAEAFIAIEVGSAVDVEADEVTLSLDHVQSILAEVRRLRALASTSSPVPAPTPEAVAGVPLSEERLYAIAKALDSGFGSPAVHDLYREVQRLRALASVFPGPAPTPEAVQQAITQISGDDGLLKHVGAMAEEAGEDDLFARYGDALRVLLNYLATRQPPREGEIHPDTARLDWMQRHAVIGWSWGRLRAKRVDAPADAPAFLVGPDGITGDSLREALDTAMQQSATPEGR